MVKIISELFTTFNNLKIEIIPLDFPSPFLNIPHRTAQLAALHLQSNLLPYLDHNFGLNHAKTGRPIGKMFGVLVVKDQKGTIGYLSAFSGKLKGGNHYKGFVPPVYDGLQEGGFLNKGMTELSVIVEKVRVLQASQNAVDQAELDALITQRANHSKELQEKLFSCYHFLNSNKESRSLLEIFNPKQPQGGSGECAAPKLLQYAFQNNLLPISIAEFWWGISPKSQHRFHKEYYPACEEKCRPILSWMLD